jgi:hypothetical protein
VLLLRVPSSSSPAKGLYNPKAFITHAASLDQGCPHCPRFPTAASRRSLGRVSVPVWLTILSDQLPITALVGHYPTNQLIGRGPIPGRLNFGHHPLGSWRHPVLAAVSRGCPGAQGRYPRVTHPFATRIDPEGTIPVRLACVRRAASVRSEPGSNSQLHPCSRRQTRRPGSRAPSRDRAPGPASPRRGPHGITSQVLPEPGPEKTSSKDDRSPSPDHAQSQATARPQARPRPRNPPHPKMRKTNGQPPPPTHPFLASTVPKSDPERA